MSFDSLPLDSRLKKAIAKLELSEMTDIQKQCIPLVLEGKDVIGRARTGSGKTLAYALPALQRLLEIRSSSHHVSNMLLGGKSNGSAIFVLVPSRELCAQVCAVFKSLLRYCSRTVTCLNVSSAAPTDAIRKRLEEDPDILVGTPAGLAAHVPSIGEKWKNSLRLLIVDEADLMFSFGYEEDVRCLLQAMPSVYQALLFSATISDDMQQLRHMLLHNPVTVSLKDAEQHAAQLKQLIMHVTENGKYLALYTLIRCQLLVKPGEKMLVYVNDLSKCYRLKMYLDAFGIPAGVLNSELPVNSRRHVLSSFNSGVFDCLVATDESFLHSSTSEDHPAEENGDDQDEAAAMDGHSEKSKKKKKKDKQGGSKKEGRRNRKDAEFGAIRGLDFSAVSVVVNFDFPREVADYMHRVGRTARGTQEGTALSLWCDGKDAAVLAALKATDADLLKQDSLLDFELPKDLMDGFAYRSEDVLATLTTRRVKHARLRELRLEALNNERLKAHFDAAPNDIHVLKHEAALGGQQIKRHLRDIQDYMIPEGLAGMSEQLAEKVRPAVGAKHTQGNGGKGKGKQTTAAGSAKRRRMQDPLRSLKVKY
jgi:ATP-dependent RNA helicase DDX56/DBP9